MSDEDLEHKGDRRTNGPAASDRAKSSGSSVETNDELRRKVHRRLAATYIPHRNIFAVVNAGCHLANLIGGPPWWAIWPLLVTGLPFLIHYLALKTLSVDDAWADERAENIHARAYDRGQIEGILEDHHRQRAKRAAAKR